MTAIDDYVKDVFGSDANVVEVSELGHPTEELKGFGYGRPYQITFFARRRAQIRCAFVNAT